MLFSQLGIPGILILILFCFPSNACSLNGYSSGECVAKQSVIDEIPFCGYDSYDYICVPIARELWPIHTLRERDKTIRIDFINELKQRLIDELKNDFPIILLKDDTCYRSYQQFLCKWNFPPCDPKTDTTLQICQSVCTKYYSSCSMDLTPCLQKFQKLGTGLDENC